jgi:hypothetical protein
MRNKNAAKDFEKAVFSYLDIMFKENRARANAFSLRLKWEGLSDEYSRKLISTWIKANSSKRANDRKKTANKNKCYDAHNNSSSINN